MSGRKSPITVMTGLSAAMTLVIGAPAWAQSAAAPSQVSAEAHVKAKDGPSDPAAGQGAVPELQEVIVPGVRPKSPICGHLKILHP